MESAINTIRDMIIDIEAEDFRDHIRRLEFSGEYYVSIEPRGSANYEESYHVTAIDPDGNRRDLLGERETSLAGCPEIVNFFKAAEAGKVLDFGCGLGWLLSEIPEKWEKHGLEISKVAANHASQFARVFCGDFSDYSEDEFDVIVLNHVIEHIRNPRQVVDFLDRSLKPGGTLIVATPNFDSAAARKFGNAYRLLHDPTHITLFSEDSLRRFLRANSFRIFQVEYPFFETPWATRENLLSMLEEPVVSPAFYGSYITVFAKKLSA